MTLIPLTFMKCREFDPLETRHAPHFGVRVRVSRGLWVRRTSTALPSHLSHFVSNPQPMETYLVLLFRSASHFVKSARASGDPTVHDLVMHGRGGPRLTRWTEVHTAADEDDARTVARRKADEHPFDLFAVGLKVARHAVVTEMFASQRQTEQALLRARVKVPNPA